VVFSALVVGSIAPDFGYFVPLPSSYYMYTIQGQFLFNVPVGFVLLVLFHRLIKRPLLSLLPESWQRRLVIQAQRFSFGPAKRLCLILISLLVGSVTHMVWDSFTHSDGWLGENVTFLRTSIGGVRAYDIL
jgi:Domain of unknown function (DUF4184)